MKSQRSQNEVLEELIASVRGLDVRVRDSVEENPSSRRRRGRFHPMMMMEMRNFTREITSGKDDPLEGVILLSMLRDDLPWLYDIGLDAYKQTIRKLPGAKHARQRVSVALRMLRQGPWREIFDSKEMHFIIRDLEHYYEEHSIFDNLHFDDEIETLKNNSMAEDKTKRRVSKRQPKI